MRYLSILRYPVILLAILCASCGTALPTVKPYKLDVQQGNVVTSKMLLQLRPGMTKSQVRFIMGTPLIQDSFHGNRWDYVYQMRESGKITEQRRVILDFENELLKAVRGDVIPSGSDKSATNAEAANTGSRVVNPGAKPEKKSLLDKLKFWGKDEEELAKEATAAKAKADADETAKNAADLTKEIAIPAEEVKSILAVPMEVLPAPSLPVIEVPAPVAEVPAVIAPVVVAPEALEPVVQQPVVQQPVVQPPVVESPKAVLAPVEPKAVDTAPVQKAADNAAVVAKESMPMTATPPFYDSPSGMKFDRTLRLAPEDVEPVAKPEVVTPRAGNKAVPKPKDLPAESPPGFFDRMLEKIGF